LQDDLCGVILQALFSPAYNPVFALTARCIAHLTRLCERVVRQRKKQIKRLFAAVGVVILNALVTLIIAKGMDTILKILLTWARNVR